MSRKVEIDSMAFRHQLSDTMAFRIIIQKTISAARKSLMYKFRGPRTKFTL